MSRIKKPPYSLIIQNNYKPNDNGFQGIFLNLKYIFKIQDYSIQYII